jgi:putative copper resistance protein D
MTRPVADRIPRTIAALALWAGLAVGAAVLASVLAGALAGASLPVVLGTAVTRAGLAVAGVACVGLALLSAFLPASTDREGAVVRRRADRAMLGVAGAWLALALLSVAFRAADAFGRPVTALTADQMLRWATELAAGRGMVLTAGCAAVVVGCALVRLRDPKRLAVRIPLVAALLGTLTPAVTGHASSAPDHQLAVVTAALHVGAAALWVGGLGAVLALAAPRRTLLDAVLPRFSLLATGCVIVVAVTGLLNAQVRLESWAALLTTGYGQLVVAKAVALVLVAALGGLTRRRLATGRMPVLRWAGLEVSLMAVTLGLAAALTQAA